MATGKIKTLFSNKEKTEALFPRTKINAVSDENGVGLDAILNDLNTQLDTKASEAFVSNKIAEAQIGGGSGNVDLSGYATKDELNKKVNTTDVINIAQGGTGATTAAAARTALGITPANIGAAASSHNHDSTYMKDYSGAINLNNSYNGGLYRVLGGSNCPSYSQYGTLISMPYRKFTGGTTPDYGAQIYIPCGDDRTKANSLFYRTALSDSWNAWQEVSTVGHTHDAATQSAAGLMSATDKAKLDGIATGANKYSLPNATSSTLGGVKIGSNITVSSGTISLTKANVTNALGYTPPTTNTTYSNMTAATASAAGKAGLVPAPAAGKQNSFLRGDGTWVVPTDTKYSLPNATSSTLGGVKIGSNITVSSGTISLTKANVTSALGYTPPASGSAITDITPASSSFYLSQTGQALPLTEIFPATTTVYTKNSWVIGKIYIVVLQSKTDSSLQSVVVSPTTIQTTYTGHPVIDYENISGGGTRITSYERPMVTVQALSNNWVKFYPQNCTINSIIGFN